MNINLFVNSLDEREKNTLYKRLWFEYMKDDIVSRLDTYGKLPLNLLYEEKTK